jgi:geranylgeranyl diphosphate synthase type II
MKNMKERYTQFVQLVEDRLHNLVKDKEPKVLYEPFHYLITGGGKRIRPVLSMLACGAVSGKPELALDCGVAIEVMHNFTLAHDDIMDRSPMRRGRETVHVKWNDATAILTGDVMMGWGYRLLPNSTESSNSDKILASYTRALIDVCEGQAFDVEFNENQNTTVDDYFQMIELKTSRLLECSAEMGAYVGGASEEEVKALNLYAKYLGYAFQLQDDLLDIVADEAEFGKTVGLDIQEGKKTYMILYAKEHTLTHFDRELLDKFFAQNGLPKEYVNDMKYLLERTGAIESAEVQINSFFNKAKEELNKLNPSEYRDMLDWLIDSLHSRKK